MNVDMYLGGDNLVSMGLSFQKPSSVKSRTHVCHGNVTSPSPRDIPHRQAATTNSEKPRLAKRKHAVNSFHHIGSSR